MSILYKYIIYTNARARARALVLFNSWIYPQGQFFTLYGFPTSHT